MITNSKLSDSFSKAYWPKIVDSESAIQAIKLGAWAAVFGVVTSIGMSFVEVAGFTAQELMVGAIMWGGIAWGIFNKSRFAAVTGLLIYLCDRLYALSMPDPRTLNAMNILMVIWLINGVRGTYQYRRYEKIEKSDASTS